MQYIEVDQKKKKSTNKLEFSSTKLIFPQEAVTKDCLVQNILMKSSIVEPQHVFILFSKVLVKFPLVYLNPYRFQFYLKVVISPTHNNYFRFLPYASFWWLLLVQVRFYTRQCLSGLCTAATKTSTSPSTFYKLAPQGKLSGHLDLKVKRQIRRSLWGSPWIISSEHHKFINSCRLLNVCYVFI